MEDFAGVGEGKASRCPPEVLGEIPGLTLWFVSAVTRLQRKCSSERVLFGCKTLKGNNMSRKKRASSEVFESGASTARGTGGQTRRHRRRA